jgi:uncharacterized protein
VTAAANAKRERARETQRQMTRWTFTAALAGALWLAACDGQEPPPAVSRQTPIVPVDTGTVRIETGGRTVHLSVEIAATEEQQRVGLMERASLPEDEGMLFVYDEPQPGSAGFTMFRTLVPLDIAFLDRAGRILVIVPMEPCQSPVAFWCDHHAPGIPYNAALEVNHGFFERHGIDTGARVQLISRSP